MSDDNNAWKNPQRLLADIREWQKQEGMVGALRHHLLLAQAVSVLSAVVAERDAALADAKRYRELRGDALVVRALQGAYGTPERLDEAVDAAIKKRAALAADRAPGSPGEPKTSV